MKRLQGIDKKNNIQEKQGLTFGNFKNNIIFEIFHNIILHFIYHFIF